MSIAFYVRLKPRALKRRKGLPQTPSRYMYAGIRFEEVKGWYRIEDAELAKVLARLTHNDREDGLLIFDVLDGEAARALEEKERRSTRTRAQVDNAAEIVTVTPKTRRMAGRASAVSVGDIRPEAEMIDGAEGETEEEFEDEAEPIGKLTDGEPDQELDDADDLLDGTREPRAPKLTETAAPQTRKKPVATPKKRAAPKAAPAPRTRSTQRVPE